MKKSLYTRVADCGSVLCGAVLLVASEVAAVTKISQ